jgi:CBS domain-containing protein
MSRKEVAPDGGGRTFCPSIRRDQVDFPAISASPVPKRVRVVLLRQVLTTSRVGQLVPKDVPVLKTEDSVAQAVSQMRSHSHGSALVYRGEQLAGIFTERDLLKLVSQGKSLDVEVSSVMTADPRTVHMDDSLLTVIKLMDEGGYRRLPVVDKAGLPVGIIDVKSVMHFLVEHFPAAVYNQAPRALLNAKSREGA